MSSEPIKARSNIFVRAVEGIIFNVKWVLPLFYMGLVVVMGLYGLAYLKEIIETIARASTYTTDDMKIVVLDFVDIVMVANLVKMIIAGSYNSFISKNHGRQNENISSGQLKIKITTSIVIVCSIHLLRSFVTNTATVDSIIKQLYIYGAFLASALVLGVLEYLHVKQELEEAAHEKNH